MAGETPMAPCTLAKCGTRVMLCALAERGLLGGMLFSDAMQWLPDQNLHCAPLLRWTLREVATAFSPLQPHPRPLLGVSGGVRAQ